MQKIEKSILFQGANKTKQYFEGWYFKHVDENQEHVFCVIPGINYEDNEQSAFVQIIIGPTFKSYYISYDIDDFHYTNDPFSIRIGNNIFSVEGITLDIDNEDIKIAGKISYDNISRLQNSILQPNIMGIFGYLKSMQCNHGVVSLNHNLQGQISYNEKIINFSNGKGYSEKDWGDSFPKKYIWIQCNNFDNDSVSLLSSIANVPFLKRELLGFIMVLKVGDTQYRFATYNHSKLLNVKFENNVMSIIVKHKQLVLSISAKINESHVLKAPVKGVMSDDVYETLQGAVTVKLEKNGAIIFSGESKSAGVEVVNWD